ncbi:hypothetical protein [Mucilaginibacter phyllosphaerae]|uniref:Uncharacterized protein n=1 Tax=Mucilaginibacter phyllosphaerae TaxID=1812349 RepID=A0A4Y8AA91_9SPHI|nr:hypothetical protein [Mucilaginibacter phyllosphaerae]MBB3969919.1 hypothetical protein [Mucilaginibacter phyllosphaerae]TEW65293.1 hypothetical protein E2R65_15385 [Mucilaginibacter phyllosphaerae]GGH16799.1 hypothetical protein GCM10007352_26440 [Mucilaginibacter phyllosphaerae]
MAKYHFYNNLTNENELIQTKVRYLADYFDFLANNLGAFQFPSFENHKSLFNKINFQLINYTEHSSSYIQHYLKHQLFSKNDYLLKKHYQRIFIVIDELRSKAYVEAEKRQELINNILLSISNLDKTMFKKVAEEIVIVVQCEKDLHQHNHKEILEYCALIMITEFAYENFPIDFLKRVFEKVLTNNVVLKKDEVVTDAPLPEVLVFERDNLKDEPEKYYELVQSYLENRNLQQQLEGLYHLFKHAKKTFRFLFKLNNVGSKEAIKIAYKGTLITSTAKFYLQKNPNNKEYLEFFSTKHQLYLETEVIAANEKSAKFSALRKANDSLLYINDYFEKNAVINDRDYIICQNKKCTRIRPSLTGLFKDSVAKFNKSHDTKNLGKIDTIPANLVNHRDIIYLLANSDSYPDQKLNHYWRYLEGFFNSGADVIERLPIILSNLSLNYTTWSYCALLHENLYKMYQEGIRGEDLGWTEQDFFKNLNANFFTKELLKTYNQHIKHPYLNRTINKYLKTKISSHHNNLINYYRGILKEAYEQRNFIQHSGVYHSNAVFKVLLQLPNMVFDFRRLMIKQAIKGEVELEGILLKLTVQPKKLQKAIKKQTTVEQY